MLAVAIEKRNVGYRYRKVAFKTPVVLRTIFSLPNIRKGKIKGLFPRAFLQMRLRNCNLHITMIKGLFPRAFLQMRFRNPNLLHYYD